MSTVTTPVTTKTRVKDVDFVKACLKATTLEDAADTLGMKKSGVQARARRLRKAGVKLPNFKPGVRLPRKPEVEALNALIASES